MKFKLRHYPEPPLFDYAQSIVHDTRRIRGELGYREVVGEDEAMTTLAQRYRAE